MAIGPAFAGSLAFRKEIGALIQECIEASKTGYEVADKELHGVRPQLGDTSYAV